VVLPERTTPKVEMAVLSSPPSPVTSLLLFTSSRVAPPLLAGCQVASTVFNPDAEGEGFFALRRWAEMVGKGQILKWARDK
jgi:hypothetical protein